MKFSVIIPVYNVKMYLERCLDSILNTRCSDVEVIIVNDGSTDGSADMCDEMSKKSGIFKVFHQENQGVSSARNLALSYASGEWVIFVDADDYVSEDFFCIEETDADIVERSFSVFNQYGEKESCCIFPEGNLRDKKDIYSFFVQRRNNALWNKVFRRSLIKDIKFDETVSIGEDFLFYLAALIKTKKYCFSGIGEYFYCKRNNSVMHSTSSNDRIEVLFDNIENVNLLLKSDFKELRDGIIYTTYVPYLFSLRKIMTNIQIDKMNKLIEQIPYANFKYLSVKNKLKMYLLYLFLVLA